MNQWELSMALSMLGLDEQQKQTVVNALPIAAKLINHVYGNKQLFATIFADGMLCLPAAKILLDALAAKGYTPQSFSQLLEAMQTGGTYADH